MKAHLASLSYSEAPFIGSYAIENGSKHLARALGSIRGPANVSLLERRFRTCQATSRFNLNLPASKGLEGLEGVGTNCWDRVF